MGWTDVAISVLAVLAMALILWGLPKMGVSC